ncbi:MAG TPA: hypothetical protein PLM63_02910 [bacterium]|jgi:hypothetical protein|nr:hypothetical protein [bacterium]
MSKSRILKTVFTLKSGKSIVVSMYEDQCFKLYNQWVESKKSTSDEFIVVHEKKKQGEIIEMIGILVSEIAAVQIVENINKFTSEE